MRIIKKKNRKRYTRYKNKVFINKKSRGIKYKKYKDK